MQVVEGQFAVSHHHIGVLHHHAHGIKIGQRIEVQLVQMAIDTDVLQGAHENGVPIRFGTNDSMCANVASRTWYVVDHHRLTKTLRHFMAY
ncbi:hypothetical protein D3C85_1627080 [compost metagenome]